jgi:hypothetical protein
VLQKTAKRDKLLWEEFLHEFYEDGKRLVQNTNRDTRDRFPKVEVLTLLKTDPKFRKLVRGQFQRWTAQREKSGPGGEAVEHVDDLQQGHVLEWMENKQRVRGVVQKARRNRAILEMEGGGKRHLQQDDVERLQPRLKQAKIPRVHGKPHWDEFLVEVFGKEGGKTKIRNENPETQDRFAEVEVETLLKEHAPFQDKLIARYHEWVGKDDEEGGTRHGYRLGEFVKNGEALAGSLEQLAEKHKSLKSPEIKKLIEHLRHDKSPSLKLLYQAEAALKHAELSKKEKGGPGVEKIRAELHEPRRHAQHALDPDRMPLVIEADKEALEGLTQVAKHRKAIQEIVGHIKNQDPVEPDLLDKAIDGLGEWGDGVDDKTKGKMAPAALALLNAQAQMYIQADENGMPTKGVGAKRLADPKTIDKEFDAENLRTPRKWQPNHEIIHYADAHVPIYKERYGDFFESLDHKFEERAKDYEEEVIGKHHDPQMRHFLQKTWDERPTGERELYVGGHEVGEKFYRDVLSMRERAALNKALHAWQDGTNYPDAHQLYGLLQSFGVEGGEREDDKGQEVGKHRKLGGQDASLKKAIAKAMAFSKAYYDHLGLDKITLYRGMRAPEEAEQGDTLKVDGARELAAFSMSPLTAYTFAIGGKKPKRVVKYTVPVERLFLSPVTYPALGSPPPWAENEYIVAGIEALKGKMMPTHLDDYDPKMMKTADQKVWSAEIEEDEETAWHQHIDQRRHKHRHRNEDHKVEKHRKGKMAALGDLALKNRVFREALLREMRKSAGSGASSTSR